MKLNIKYIVAALLSAIVALPLGASAQETKTFTAPKAGDYSFGIDAAPVVNFLGNMFNGTMNQTLDDIGGTPVTSSSGLVTPDISILGRYMLSGDLAVRANVGLIIDNSYNTAYATDDLAVAENPLSEAKVVDGKTTARSGASLAVGLEYRIGKGRIQGVFSGNVLYAYSTESYSYSYGNAITSLNQSPSSGGLDTNNHPTVSYMSTLRTLKVGGGATHMLGLMGTAGVEWFVASRISLGLEVNLVAAYAYTTQAYGEYEGYNANTSSVETYTNLSSPASSALYVGTNNFGSNLTLNFYF
ncbi:MAG: hypothetical protein SNH94_04785 [Rikenellaceae bacterium]